MAKTIKMCDMDANIAGKVFEMLNDGKIQFASKSLIGPVIITDVEPFGLVYPEGWYYAKGSFRNKHTSSTGIYNEIRMIKINGEAWSNYAKYCTLD